VSTTTTTSSGSVTLTAETGYLFISPVGFLTRAEDFLDASILLSQKSGRFSFVAAHLSCSAIELALKAFLLAKGGPKTDVKKFGHNLQKVLMECYRRGLGNVVVFTQSQSELLLRVNDDYVVRNFAYFEIDSAIVRPKDSELELLPTVAQIVVGGVRQTCLEAAGG
jgi:hypothetical protein